MTKLCSHLIFAEVLGTIDYVAPDGTIIFRTCSAEKDKVVFQMVCFIILILSKIKFYQNIAQMNTSFFSNHLPEMP